MFHVRVVKHGENSHLRQKGKIAELALGYGGGINAMKAMGAIENGMKEEELQPIVDAWRAASPNVTKFWWDVDSLVKRAIQYPGQIFVLPAAGGNVKLVAKRSNRILSIQLPSGRCIRYFDPDIGINKFGSESVTYYGLEAGKWGQLESYGPKIVENIVQATSRDCLRDAMLRAAERLPDIVMHIHDEMVIEVPKDEAEKSLDYMKYCMGTPLEWAPGLLLRGDGYITDYYRKD